MDVFRQGGGVKREKMQIRKGEQVFASVSLGIRSLKRWHCNKRFPGSFRAQFVLDKPPELGREALKGKQWVS